MVKSTTESIVGSEQLSEHRLQNIQRIGQDSTEIWAQNCLKSVGSGLVICNPLAELISQHELQGLVRIQHQNVLRIVNANQISAISHCPVTKG